MADSVTRLQPENERLSRGWRWTHKILAQPNILTGACTKEFTLSPFETEFPFNPKPVSETKQTHKKLKYHFFTYYKFQQNRQEIE